MKQKLKALAKRPDPPAAVFGALMVLCSSLHIPDRIGISADELGIAMGATITIAASVRTWLQHRAEASA